MSLFFFSSRRRHTRWPRDWSSDVCSSDLPPLHVTAASTCSRVDHLRFGSIARDLVALLALGFPSPPQQSCLGWPRTITRRLIMQKASSHPVHSEIRSEERRVGKECRSRWE